MPRSDSSRALREKLKALAVVVDVSSTVPLGRYYALARQLHQSSLQEFNSQDYERAYVHIYKFVTLVFNKIPTHNAFNTKQFQPDLYWAKRAGKDAMDELERIVEALDTIEDEKIMTQSQLDLINELEDDVLSSPQPFVNDDKDSKSAVVEQSIHEKLSITNDSGASFKKDKELTVIFNKLKLQDTPPFKIEPAVVPSPLSSSAHDHITATTNSIIPSNESASLISSHELDILIFLNDFRRFQIPVPRSSVLTLSLNNALVKFCQDDFHVSFQIFLSSLPAYLQMTPSALETNRCFFIHIGVALQIHPFALQTAFRLRTRQLLSKDSTDDLAKEILSTVVETAGLVDANCLMYLWPAEFRAYRVCIISGDANLPIISIFQSKHLEASGGSNVDTVPEIILRCRGCHFTLLRPYGSSINSSLNTFSFVNTFAIQAKRAGLTVLTYTVDDDVLDAWSVEDVLKRAILSN